MLLPHAWSIKYAWKYWDVARGSTKPRRPYPTVVISRANNNNLSASRADLGVGWGLHLFFVKDIPLIYTTLALDLGLSCTRYIHVGQATETSPWQLLPKRFLNGAPFPSVLEHIIQKLRPNWRYISSVASYLHYNVYWRYEGVWPWRSNKAKEAIYATSLISRAAINNLRGS